MGFVKQKDRHTDINLIRTRQEKIIIYVNPLPLSDGEYKAPRSWGTPEDRALRDMSLSAGVMVRRGTPD